MRATVLAVAAGLCLVASAAYAGDQQAAAASPSEQMVCKVMIHEGMVTNKAICLTRARWDTIQRGNSRALLDFQVASYHAPFGH